MRSQVRFLLAPPVVARDYSIHIELGGSKWMDRFLDVDKYGYEICPESNLVNADLSWAKLQNANLARANLSNANLSCMSFTVRTSQQSAIVSKPYFRGFDGLSLSPY